MKHTFLVCALPLAALPTPALAEAADLIVVTASRTMEESSGLSAIEAEEIGLVQPLNALEMLDREAGVRAFTKGGAAGPSYLSIRGGEPNFTLVLLDGAKVNDPTNSRGGSFDFGQIDPRALERIEIARGGLSAVHGSDALSGVVNLRLRSLDPGESLASGLVGADSEEGVQANGTGGIGWSAGSLLASGSYADSGDITRGSDIERWQAFARLRQNFAGIDISLLGLHAAADRELFPEDSGGPRLAAIREREVRETKLDLLSAEIAGEPARNWQPRLALHWTRQDDDSDTPPIAPGPVMDGVPAIRSDGRFRRAEAVFDNKIRLGETATLAFGTAYLHEQGDSKGTIDFGMLIPADFSIERSIVSGFAEATVEPVSGLSATAGIRHDDASTASGEWTGRANLRWAPIATGPAFVASWSEGYKLPSLYALAYPIIANPGLRPERSTSFDLGLEQNWGGGRARLAYFHSRYTDLIDFDPERFTNVNRSRVTAQGVEAELSAPLTATLGVTANVTHLDTDQPADAPPLRSRPEWEGLLAFDWQPTERLHLQATGEYTAKFFDSSIPTGLVSLDSRFLLSAAARYRLSPQLSLSLSAHNLLDEDYEDVVGFPSPGRRFRLSLSFTG